MTRNAFHRSRGSSLASDDSTIRSTTVYRGRFT